MPARGAVARRLTEALTARPETRGIHKLTSRTNAADLSGKVAVVTGAAAGLGRAEALGLARLGATVVVNDIAAALDASDVIDEINGIGSGTGSKAVAVAGDISERSTADELVAQADGLGGLDIVVNNAGITRDRMLFNMTDEEWYDQEIAPKLWELAKECEKRGLSFVCAVECESGTRSVIRSLTATAGLEMQMINHCVKTAPNIDAYVMGLAKYCREKGIRTDNSMIMRLMGEDGKHGQT